MHAPTRREVLTEALGASLLRAAQARAQAPTARPGLFDIERVAEGVYAAVARPAALINCNAAIFENANDLLIVDTHSKSSSVASLAGQIRKEVSGKPIRYIVNTHFHWDHTQGTPEYRRLAPGAQVLSSTATRNLIAEFGAARLKASLEELPKSIEQYQAKLSAARTPAEQAHYRRMIEETRGYLAEMRNYAPELPSITFQDSLIIHDKAHDLQLAFRGRGHTAGDIVVFCSQQKVIASGDLLHGFLPFLGDGYPREWPRTLQAVGGFEFQHVIGGHGAVQHTRERLGQMAAYIEELTAAVEKGKSQGRSSADLQREITPASLRSLGGGYGEFAAASLIRFDASQALRRPAEVLAEGVRENVASTFTALERS